MTTTPDAGHAGDGPGAGLLAMLWAVVVIELVLPVPGALSLGAAYVLIARPPWFARLVDELYCRRTADEADPGAT